MSNKTLKKLPEETESAPKGKFKKYLGISVFAVFFLLLLYSSIKLLVVYVNADTLNAPEGVVFIEIADSPEERRVGLSGRSSIDEDSGLLFVFDSSSKDNCFWMKDMNFSIDMVWLNEEKEVVTVISDVSPETYPETFCPDEPAKYGLEINAGKSAELGISTGITLGF